MSTDLRDQIRQLTSAFDQCVDDLTIDEVLDRDAPTISFDDREHPNEIVPALGATPVSRRLGTAAAWVLLAAGLVGVLVWIGRDESVPTTGTSPATAPPVTSATPFVWPAPDGFYATLGELVASFTADVLGWDGDEWKVGNLSEEPRPQTFTMVNHLLESEVTVVAVPWQDRWGFSEVGQGLTASTDQRGNTALTWPVTYDATSSTATIRLTDGSVVETSGGGERVEVADVHLDDLASALVVLRNEDGRALTALGTSFNDASTPLNPTENEITDIAPSTPESIGGPPASEPTDALVYPVFDLDGCLPLWIDADTQPAVFGGVYGWGNVDGLPVQVLTPSDGSIDGPFAVAVRAVDNPRFNPDTANTTVDDVPARATFANPTWGDVLWRLPDGTDAYLRTSTMTQDQLVELASMLTARPVDAEIPGFDLTGDTYRLIDEGVTPIEVGPTAITACSFDDGGWLRASVVAGDAVGQALALTDRPAREAAGATRLLGDGGLLIVMGSDDLSEQQLADGLMAVRNATDDELAELLGKTNTVPTPDSPRSSDVRDFDLYTHCGIHGTMIDGRWWAAVEPLDDGNGNPPPGWGNPVQRGTLSLTQDEAVFSAAGGLVARFEPTDLVAPPFSCD